MRLRRSVLETLEDRRLLSVSPNDSTQHLTLADMPAAEQSAISTAIGRDESAYYATAAGQGAALANPGGGFSATVQSGALHVVSGSDTWDLALAAYGRGAALQAVGTANTVTANNRVDCNYAGLDAWYVNGPAGIEQGFTIDPASVAPASGGLLTVALAMGGDLHAVANAAGDGVNLLRADGSQALGYTGLSASDAAGHTLPATMEVSTLGGQSQLLIHVNDTGAQGPITIDPVVQQARLLPSGYSTLSMGQSVAVSGNTVVAGDPTGNGGLGAVYVFTQPAAGWSGSVTAVAKLTSTNSPSLAQFGKSVAIDGNTIVVGAYRTKLFGNIDQGAAYVFVKPANGWTNMNQTAMLTASDGQASDYFGYSVAVSGQTVVVGASGATVNGNSAQGAVYEFTMPASGWVDNTETAKLTASDGKIADQLGSSVAVDGSNIVAGAVYAQGAVFGSGAAYVYSKPGAGDWVDAIETAKLSSSSGALGDSFGTAVAISGNTIVVGASGATIAGKSGQGAAYVYVQPANGWLNMTQSARLTASDGVFNDHFGAAVAISGNFVVAGAPNATVGGNLYEGAAYEFARPVSGWASITESAKFEGSDSTGNNWFGTAVGISGSTAVAGPEASPATTFGGEAYVFSVQLQTTVTGVTPNTGLLAGGGTVTITGNGFTAAGAVDFGTQAATSYTVVNDTTITAIVPPGLAGGTVDITVTSPTGTSATSTADQYTYLAPTAVNKLAPATGPLAGGTTVIITGTGFTGATSVMFGGSPANSYSVFSPTQITAVAPAGIGFVDVVVTSPTGTSNTTSADVYSYVTTPAVSGVAPAAGPLGGGALVTITGSNFTGATAVKFGNVNAVSYTVINDDTITAKSPAGSGTVDITVTTLNGTSPQSTPDQFTYQTLPAVTRITPNTGLAGGGTTVVIAGTDLNGATGVNFGTVAATSFTVNSPVQITATAPAGSGIVDVTVVTPGGASLTSTSDRFTYLAVPTVGGVTPASGPAAGGNSVVITGTGFTSITGVNFGALAATRFTINSPTQITATVPAGTGTIDVTVANGVGTSSISSSDQYTYVPPPVVNTISPPVGTPLGGTVVMIVGSGFASATGVIFGGLSAPSFTIDSPTLIAAIAPAGTGTVDVTVTAVGTSTTSSADRFTYAGPPTVRGVGPASGPLAGGTSVTISGTGFTYATGVKFGTSPAASVTVLSDTQLVAVSPAGSGTVDLTVTSPTGTSATSSADRFTYTSAPTITAVSPASGPMAGGTSVTITGTGLAGVTAVQFGSVPAAGYTVNSSTQITATSPAGAGTVDVTVTSAQGTSIASTADQFAYNSLPVVGSLTPAAGPLLGGTSVVLRGSGFSGATLVKFGSIAASFTVNSDGQITAISPSGSGTVDVTATTSYGTSITSAGDQFTYTSAPTVTRISPTIGGLTGGTNVTITGTGFTGTTSVKFGGLSATSFTVNSDTQITATSPAGSGTVDITIGTAKGTSPVSTNDQFTYSSSPRVSGVSPASGPATGGTSVVITGASFTGATAVKFGTLAAASFKVNSDTQITAISPAGSGTVDLMVVSGLGVSQTVAADQFTYLPAPAVMGVTPGSGPSTGGTSVTISGTNLAGATAVAFDGAAGTILSDNGTQIMALSPPHAAATVNVTVTTASGTSAVTAADQFAYTGHRPSIVALYDPTNSMFHFRSSNSAGPDVFTVPLGQSGDVPLVGDWDGTGNDGVGVFDPRTSTFSLVSNLATGTIEYRFTLGAAGLVGADQLVPIVGDWNGTGKTGVGVYDPKNSTFSLVSSLATGTVQYTFGYGVANLPGGNRWEPLVGDWNGSGHVGVGLYDPVNSTFMLTSALSTGYAQYTFGYGVANLPTADRWEPLVGDWLGSGHAGVALYDPTNSLFMLTTTLSTGFAQYTFGYGVANLPVASRWKPTIGDWTGAGKSSVGLYDPTQSTFYLTSTLRAAYADNTFTFGTGSAGWEPLSGHWQTATLLADSVVAGANVSALDSSAVNPLLAAAEARWVQAGLPAALVPKLSQVSVVVTDLPGAQLGETVGNTIYLDATAAGHGWFVDPAPAADGTFALQGDGQLHAVDPLAVDRIDLLTVVEHELGHVAGLDDLAPSATSLMSGVLPSGVRRDVGAAEIDAVLAATGGD